MAEYTVVEQFQVPNLIPGYSQQYRLVGDCKRNGRWQFHAELFPQDDTIRGKITTEYPVSKRDAATVAAVEWIRDVCSRHDMKVRDERRPTPDIKTIIRVITVGLMR